MLVKADFRKQFLGMRITNSVPNVTISACGNTIKGMSKKAGKDIEIVPNARVVPGGIIRLMELSDQGYFMIRP